DIIDVSPYLKHQDGTYFIITLPSRVFLLNASTSLDATRWLVAIREALEDVKNCRNVFQKRAAGNSNKNYQLDDINTLPNSFRNVDIYPHQRNIKHMLPPLPIVPAPSPMVSVSGMPTFSISPSVKQANNTKTKTKPGNNTGSTTNTTEESKQDFF